MEGFTSQAAIKVGATSRKLLGKMMMFGRADAGVFSDQRQVAFS